ncbi:MAG: hypothetical protein SPL37_02880 [Prevotella sp.]|nr:hypothetical protein [Prevotella sp.]
MRKITLLLMALVMTISANAQFKAGKGYVGASLTGLDLHYNGQDKLKLGVEAKAGYLPWDNIMLLAEAGIQHNGDSDVPDDIRVGVGARYYITQNGLYLGANCKLVHASHNYNDLMPGAEVGYAFFINRSVTIEPAVYYDQSFKKSKYSTVGLKVGIGIYLFDD